MRLDILRRLGFRLEFLAERRHKHAQRRDVVVPAAAPYLLRYVRMRQDFSDVLREEAQKFVFDWGEFQLNPAIAPEGGSELVKKAIEDMKNGRIHVFRGDYIGYNPTDPSDSWDLNTEYHENSEGSAPTFHYILQDVIIVE